MPNPVPDLLALASIADGSQRLAAPIRNNFSAIQTAVNENVTVFSGGASGQVLQAADASHLQWAYPPGYEFAYSQIVAPVNITDTVEATATALITASFTADGSPVVFDFFAPLIVLPVAAAGTGTLILSIFEGATQIGRLAQFVNPGSAAAEQAAVRAAYRFTPSAGAHTYKVTAFVSTTTGTPSIQAASGGTGGYLPAFIRITKA